MKLGNIMKYYLLWTLGEIYLDMAELGNYNCFYQRLGGDNGNYNCLNFVQEMFSMWPENIWSNYRWRYPYDISHICHISHIWAWWILGFCGFYQACIRQAMRLITDLLRFQLTGFFYCRHLQVYSWLWMLLVHICSLILWLQNTSVGRKWETQKGNLTDCWEGLCWRGKKKNKYAL